MKPIFIAGLGLAACASFAQWSGSSASPLVIADRSGEQVQPKIAATADGGSYVAWFDNATGGYDVYLQRLDARGNELWPHNGVLVANRGVSSTQDYDLEVDAAGNAVVTFNDDRVSNAICVNKVDPSGNLLWGTNGVQIPSTGFLGFPHVAVLTDGYLAVGYSIDNTYAFSRISPAGAVVGSWTFSETGKPYTLSDIVPGDNGTAIILFVRRFSSTFTSAKALWCQKYNAAGLPQWNGGQPVPVYAPTGSPYGSQGGSIQNGAFPTMVADGNGGMVCGWYETGGPRNAYVQHIDRNGTPLFALHGVANSVTGSSLIRVSCSAAYDPVANIVYSTSVETDSSTQSQYRVLAQATGPTGTRLWGDGGVTVIATNGNQPSFVNATTIGNGMTVIGFDARSVSTGVVFGAGLDPNGNVLWGGPSSPVFLSSIVDSKSRLWTAVSARRFPMAVWGNGPTGSVDIHGARINAQDGFLGNYVESSPTSAVIVEGEENNGDLSALLTSDDYRFSLFNDAATLGGAVEITAPTPVTTPTDFYVVAETSVARLALAERISLWNVTTNAYQTMAGRVGPTIDLFARVRVPNPQSFIAGNGDVKAKIDWSVINDEAPAFDGWLLNIDTFLLEAR